MLSQADEKWLGENYPNLQIDYENQIVRGEVFFRMYYSEKTESYVLNPDKSYDSMDGCVLEDVYVLRLEFDQPNLIPNVKEIGGRIVGSKDKWGVKHLIDMHMYNNQTLCLCAKPEEKTRLPNGFNIQDFFQRLLIPYLYFQSYFEKHGKWPWKDRSHGDLGMLESYYDFKKENSQLAPEIVNIYLNYLSPELRKSILRNKPVKGHHKCICYSGQKFRKCHHEALAGYKELVSDYGMVCFATKFAKRYFSEPKNRVSS